MFTFFLPTSKVQKDRSIMRETDARMAKYSRRGLIFNFCAYLICLVGGRFLDENRDLTIILTIGLLFITVVRGFFLFRFDQIYPRAPQRWRNSYFIATLLGSFWWAVILISITLKLDMKYEAPVLWLYTVVFFSTTAHAFAPYQKFLSYYQFFGLIPAAISAFFVQDFTAYLYGVLMLVFYFVLTHQCRLISENYWERLEAAYALARKTQSIEEEKRDSRASVQLNREFLNYLRNDLQNILGLAREPMLALEEGNIDREALKRAERSFQKVYYNVCDFNSVLNKSLVLENKIFNIRHELQHIVAEFVDESESRGVLMETALSPTLPMRLKGDASRLAQIIRTLTDLSIRSLDRGVVIIDVEFLREYETAGELYINISSFNHSQKRRFFGDEDGVAAKTNLAYAVAKGIADLMSGSIEFSEISREGILYRLDAKFDIAEQAGHLDFHRNSFKGHSVMLIHFNRRVVDIKRRELTALGFEVFTESQFKRAQTQLANSYKEGKPIECVLYYYEEGNDDAREFNNNLVDHPELKYTHQLVAVSEKQQALLRKNGFIDNEFMHLVNKPAGLFELESAFKEVYNEFSEMELPIEDLPLNTIDQKRYSIILISHKEDAELQVREKLEGMQFDLKLIHDENKIGNVFVKEKPEMTLVDCDEELSFIRIVDTLRGLEKEAGTEFYMPIIGISSSSNEFESAAYELGVDDFVDLSNPKKYLRRVVENWFDLTESEEA
ncbi:hypothetical protein SAMN02745866_02500 [Alteromonadaceae bacterium Bs31]|nr:hypothetical protein SAMN02745866_02500 [Alteromonadaceae bacterium Bs31]